MIVQPIEEETPTVSLQYKLTRHYEAQYNVDFLLTKLQSAYWDVEDISEDSFTMTTTSVEAYKFIQDVMEYHSATEGVTRDILVDGYRTVVTYRIIDDTVCADVEYRVADELDYHYDQDEYLEVIR